jgi:hypothetical protein
MKIQTAFNGSLDFFIVCGFVALQRKRMKQKKMRLSEKMSIFATEYEAIRAEPELCELCLGKKRSDEIQHFR